jgi:hypothetical protein
MGLAGHIDVALPALQRQSLDVLVQSCFPCPATPLVNFRKGKTLGLPSTFRKGEKAACTSVGRRREI